MNQQAEILESLDERKLPQKQKILNMLRNAGKQGVLNTSLVNLCIGYRSRIAEMYQAGYKIEVEHIEKGVCRYTLISEPDVEIENNPSALDMLVNTINNDFNGVVSTHELSLILKDSNFNVVRKSGSFKKVKESTL